MLHDITPEEVSNCISNIKSCSAPGMDGIPPKFVKLTRRILSPYLAKLFDNCIKQEIIPRDFKVAHVIPIPKTSSPKFLDEFRPLFCSPFFLNCFNKF